MLSWFQELFAGKPEKVTVQLLAEGEARTLPGFNHGSLTLIANKGDSFEKILNNLNAYRGPDSQIGKLFTQDGAEVPLRTVINEPVRCFVRKI